MPALNPGRLLAPVAALLALAANPAGAVTTVTVPISNIASNGEYGVAGNPVIIVNLAPNATVSAVGWDVRLTAFSPSWLSELMVAAEDSSQTQGLFVAPAAGDDMSGANVSYSSGGLIDLVSRSLFFDVGSDGILRLEFFEDFNDSTVNPDGRWLSGTLSFAVSAVPEPATWGLAALGLAGVGAAARRRRARQAA